RRSAADTPQSRPDQGASPVRPGPSSGLDGGRLGGGARRLGRPPGAPAAGPLGSALGALVLLPAGRLGGRGPLRAVRRRCGGRLRGAVRRRGRLLRALLGEALGGLLAAGVRGRTGGLAAPAARGGLLR